MPKIKNWSKVGEDRWKNDNGFILRIPEGRGLRKRYNAYLLYPGEGYEAIVARGRTREDVRDMAIKFMKKNPNPAIDDFEETEKFGGHLG